MYPNLTLKFKTLNKILYLLPFLLFALSGSLNGQCQFEDLEVNVSPCIGTDTFYVHLNFDANGGTEAGFKVEGNGQFYGNYAYEDLPIRLVGIFSDCDQEYEFVVTDLEIPECQIFTDGIEICCSPDSLCTLSNLEISEIECNADQTHYEAQLSFDHQNSTSSGFDIFIDGVFFQFVEDQPPFAIGQIPLTDQFFQTFQVCENDNPNCCTYINIRSPRCAPECSLRDLTWEVQDSCLMQEEEFVITVQFNYDPDMVGETFTLRGNGNNYGTFNYTQLPVTISGIVDCDVEYELEARDDEHPDCFTSVSMEDLCCLSNDSCTIDELTVEFIECDENGYWVEINFVHDQPNEESFQININGRFVGDYAYTDLPLELLVEADADVNHFTICQNNTPWCCISRRMEAPDCEEECEINDLLARPFACDEDQNFDIYLDFEHHQSADKYFNLYVDGDLKGRYSYGELPLIFGSFLGDGTEYHLLVRDEEEESCAEDISLTAPICEDCGACTIRDIVVQISECENNLFTATIDFDHMNVESDGFTVRGNGNDYGSFLYEDLPIIIEGLESDCDLEREFVIIDNDNPECQNDIGIGVLCCIDSTGCEIGEVNIEASECDEGFVNFTIDFDYQGPLEHYFQIILNDRYLGDAQYADLPITLGPIEIDPIANTYLFVLQDSLNADCVGEYVVELSCPGPTPIPRVQNDVNLHVDNGMLELHLDAPNIENLNIIIFSASGQMIQYASIREESDLHEIPLQTTSTGVYFARIFHGTNLYYKKFIFSE